MALFVAFLLGGLWAFLMPGLTTRAAENARALWRFVVRVAPSPLLRVLLIVLSIAIVVGLIAGLHHTHLAGEAIVFLLAVVIGAFITDQFLRPGATSEATRFMFLGGVALFLIVFTIFPPDHLRRALSSLNVAGISIELVQAGPTPKLDLPSATIIEGQTLDATRSGAIVLRAVGSLSRRLAEYAALSDKLEHASRSSTTGSQSPPEEEQASSNYPSPASRELFEDYLIPLTACAAEIRSTGMTDDPDFLFTRPLQEQLRQSVIWFSQTDPSGRPSMPVVDWVGGEALVAAWDTVLLRYVELANQAQYRDAEQTEALRQHCGGLPTTEEALAAFRRLRNVLTRSSFAGTLVFPAFVAAVMGVRGDGGAAAETVAFWLDMQGDQRSHTVIGAANSMLGHSLLAVLLAQEGHRSAVTRVYGTVVEDVEAFFDVVRDKAPRLTLARSTLGANEDDLAVSDRCGLFEWNDVFYEDKALIDALAVFYTYTNNHLYSVFRDRQYYGANHLRAIAATHVTTIRRFDMDCLRTKAPLERMLHAVDTVIAVSITLARDEAWSDTAAAKHRLCDLAKLYEPLEKSLSTYEAKKRSAEQSARLVHVMRADEESQRRQELINLLHGDLTLIERSLAAIAGNPDLRFWSAYGEAC